MPCQCQRRMCRIQTYSRLLLNTIGAVCILALLRTSVIWRGGSPPACHDVIDGTRASPRLMPITTHEGTHGQLPDTGSGFYQISDGEVFLYSAFYDGRYRSKFVRLFGMQSRHLTDRVRCRVRLASGQRVELEPEATYPVYLDWPSPQLLYHAYYYGCAVPEGLDLEGNVTFSVYLEGTATETVMPLVHPSPPEPRNVGQDPNNEASSLEDELGQSRDIVVCVKALWGKVNASRLVEWMEFHRLLGVRKVVMYDTTVTGPALRVLEFYIKLGFLHLVHFNFALRMGSIMRFDPFRPHLSSDAMLLEQTYLVSMNDCYYRYGSSASYILVIDTDEIVVPSSIESLPRLATRVEQEGLNASAFLFAMAWHLTEFGAGHPEAPGALHMQRYTRRSPVMQSQPKALITSRGAISINWHGAVTMPTSHGFQGNQYVNWKKYGYVHHYRDTCKYDKNKCDVLAQMIEEDDVLPQYRDKIEQRIHNVLSELHIHVS